MRIFITNNHVQGKHKHKQTNHLYHNTVYHIITSLLFLFKLLYHKGLHSLMLLFIFHKQPPENPLAAQNQVQPQAQNPTTYKPDDNEPENCSGLQQFPTIADSMDSNMLLKK